MTTCFLVLVSFLLSLSHARAHLEPGYQNIRCLDDEHEILIPTRFESEAPEPPYFVREGVFSFVDSFR